MSLNIPTQQLLSDGKKWFAYSGSVIGDVSVPATITMINIPNTGLRDSYVTIQPTFALPTAYTLADGLGIAINIDGIEVYRSVLGRLDQGCPIFLPDICLFVPRQSELQVISLNTAANNNDSRGANVVAYYI